MKTTNTKPQLFWNERGRIGCSLPSHAPYPGSDTWAWERWTDITPTAAAEFEREVGHQPTCETCTAIARDGRDRQMRSLAQRRTLLATRALRDLAVRMVAQGERGEMSHLRDVYLADARAFFAAASAWETDGEKSALAMIARWETLPREDAIVALVRGGALTADAARLAEAGRKEARGARP